MVKITLLFDVDVMWFNKCNKYFLLSLVLSKWNFNGNRKQFSGLWIFSDWQFSARGKFACCFAPTSFNFFYSSNVHNDISKGIAQSDITVVKIFIHVKRLGIRTIDQAWSFDFLTSSSGENRTTTFFYLLDNRPIELASSVKHKLIMRQFSAFIMWLNENSTWIEMLWIRMWNHKISGHDISNSTIFREKT